MTVAIYARKSTAQKNADDDARSVARQVENARAFASERLARRRGARLQRRRHQRRRDAETREPAAAARCPRQGAPPFQVLIMRDASRFSRRDGDEAFGELKRIAQAGVEIWFYQDAHAVHVRHLRRQRRRLRARRDERRVSAADRAFTTEAMVRKAQAGHVTGGAVFGYDNVRVDGHVERRINEAEAAVVRRIFALCARRDGLLAHRANAERRGRAHAHAERGTPGGWSPSTVYEVLHRDLYRGEVIYNQTRRRAPDGTADVRGTAGVRVGAVERPELRIVTTRRGRAAHPRLEGFACPVQEASAGGRSAPARQRLAVPALGFARCTVCGGSIGVLDRRPYGCIAYHKRGTTVCRNAGEPPRRHAR